MKQTNKKRLEERFKVYLVSFYLRNTMLLLVALIAFSFTDKAGGWQSVEVPEWILLQEKDGVKAYYMISSCGLQNEMHFKIHNSSTLQKKVVWIANVKNSNNTTSALPSMSPNSLEAGGEVFSNCNKPSQLLSLTLVEEFDVTNLQFNLIVLP